MKPKMIIKIAVDIAMTLALLFLMTYELIGQATHEWLGIIMFVLFIVHHILNNKWHRSLFKGKYTALRAIQTLLVILVLLTMIGSMISGIILSHQVFSFLSINGGRSFARNLHMISAYWGFVLMSLHLGFHWNMMMNIARIHIKKASEIQKWVLRCIAALFAVYGVYAFVKRDIGSYMILKNQFVFFDFEEPLALFMIDYIASMGLFAVIGHYLCKGLKGMRKINKKA